jgi:ribosome-associated translation inhibitor RaiA
MTSPLELTFHGMTPSAAVEASAERWLSRLQLTYDHIQRCSVVIDLPHKHQRQGRQFQVTIELAVPGREIAVTHAPGSGHDDVYVALSDAFRAARRQLQDHAQIRRGA